MLKTYPIIPFTFILFLFGFTLITESPVFAWDSSMGMRHPDRPCMIVNSCGVDRRSPAEIASDPYDTGAHSPMPTSTSPSGGEVAELNAKISGLEARLGEVAQLNAKISGLEAGLTELKGVVRALQEQSNNSMQQGAPTAPSGSESQVATLTTAVAELKKHLNDVRVCMRSAHASWARTQRSFLNCT